ncbi:hypothetical protein BpHYR1_010559 [Brachionus plicatilis]|uniref:Uncharacterized protein n=1 Tax=Brachionus plicatilis TaxID=10195 RepID=A0A3M7T8C1_BRAPC|nr:hypothetical protein BpHYR1_010559 [Brachionus plicatilis]
MLKNENEINYGDFKFMGSFQNINILKGLAHSNFCPNLMKMLRIGHSDSLSCIPEPLEPFNLEQNENVEHLISRT